MNERVKIDLWGSVAILNVGEGDTKLSFDPKNPAERARVAKIITDMLRLGYAIMAEDPPGSGRWTRVQGFREETCEYLVVDVDDVQREREHQREATDEPSTEASAGAGAAQGGETSTPIPEDHPVRRGRPRGPRTKPVKAERTRVVAISRSAGG